MNSSQNFSDLVPNLPHPEIPGIMLSTLLTFFHLIFKHFYTIDIVDAKRAVQDYTHLEVTAPGSEPKLSKSKILVREKHILLGPTPIIQTQFTYFLSVILPHDFMIFYNGNSTLLTFVSVAFVSVLAMFYFRLAPLSLKSAVRRRIMVSQLFKLC